MKYALIFGAWLAIAMASWADEPKKKPTTSEADHTFERAGMPLNIRAHAQPSVTSHNYLGYIGGGSLIKCDGGTGNDGTFGMDYANLGHPGRLFLGWFHEKPKQPIAPTYRIDGPRPVERIRESHFGSGRE